MEILFPALALKKARPAVQIHDLLGDDLCCARRSTIDKEKKALLELAHHWMVAALQSESTVVVNDSPTEHRAP
jgi:hypothetical protein